MKKDANKAARRLVGLSTAVMSFAGIAAMSNTAQADSATENTTSTSEMVDRFEQTDIFRGIANEQLPASPAGGFNLGELTVTVDNTNIGHAADGYVDYGTIDTDVTLIASSDGNKMDRFAIIIEEGGPDSYQFPATVPDGSTIEHNETGTITIETPTGTETTIAPAVAVDANGTAVNASYTLTADTLTIDVDLDGATYPVMVDPVSTNHWWGYQEWHSRSDVRRFASWYGVLNIAKRACNAAPWHLKTVCRATVGRYTSWIYNTWMDAKRYNQCVWMKTTWTGQVIGVGRYSCNWG